MMPDPTLEHEEPATFLVENAHKIQTDTVLVSDEDSMGAFFSGFLSSSLPNDTLVRAWL
jgi:hypothetical protein